MTSRLRARPLLRRPTVSVLVPCYNYGRFLAGSVGSALAQVGVDVDVLIIDDCSDDGSGEMAEELAAADPRVKLIRHERNRGHIATYNEGLGAIDGEYQVLLDADDMLTPGSLARAAALMEAHPSVGMVYGFPVQYRDSPPPPKTRVRSWTLWDGHDWIERRCRRATNCIFTPEVVMRGSVQREIGGYDPALPHSGDFEMWLRAAAVADVGRVNGADQAYYRVHPDSMQHTVYAGALVDLHERQAAFASVLTGPGSRVSDGGALYARACRGMAAEAIALAVRAYDEGRVAEEPVDGYVTFATGVYPEATSLAAWRTLERRRRQGLDSSRGGLAAGRRLANDLGDRLRWRRWRWSGV
jgi:Glycosyl transferase family 2